MKKKPCEFCEVEQFIEFVKKVKQFILENCCVTDDDVDAIWKELQRMQQEVKE